VSDVVLTEIQKAREALEAKGAFTEANAATHIILALEALTEERREQARLQEKFFASLDSRKAH
jgi:hypothetical protein